MQAFGDSNFIVFIEDSCFTIASNTSQNSPFSTVKLFFVFHKNGYFTGKKCDKNVSSEFLGHFFFHSCYLAKEIFFFANLNFPLNILYLFNVFIYINSII